MKNILAALILVAASSSFVRAQNQTDFSIDPRAGDLVAGMKKVSADGAHFRPVADTGGVGDYSDGYRMGLLSKYSVKGWVNKSGEGELLMGQDSSVAYEGTGDSRKMINPWEFSSDSAMASKIMPYAGQYVVIHYHQYMLNNPLKRDTDYEAVEIAPVDTASKPKAACVNDAAAGKNSAGFRMARIVKASFKGLANKSYEIKVQMGGSGNEFYDMSVSNQAMFDCATQWLKSGGKVKIYYTQSFLFNPLNRYTGYDIQKLEPMPSLD